MQSGRPPSKRDMPTRPEDAAVTFRNFGASVRMTEIASYGTMVTSGKFRGPVERPEFSQWNCRNDGSHLSLCGGRSPSNEISDISRGRTRDITLRGFEVPPSITAQQFCLAQQFVSAAVLYNTQFCLNTL
jgi:hypothetical protein